MLPDLDGGLGGVESIMEAVAGGSGYLSDPEKNDFVCAECVWGRVSLGVVDADLVERDEREDNFMPAGRLDIGRANEPEVLD